MVKIMTGEILDFIRTVRGNWRVGSLLTGLRPLGIFQGMEKQQTRSERKSVPILNDAEYGKKIRANISLGMRQADQIQYSPPQPESRRYSPPPVVDISAQEIIAKSLRTQIPVKSFGNDVSSQKGIRTYL